MRTSVMLTTLTLTLALTATAYADSTATSPPSAPPSAVGVAPAPATGTVPAQTTPMPAPTAASAFDADAATVSTTTTTGADDTNSGAFAPTTSASETRTLRERVRPNKALLFTGGFMFLGSYVTTAAITAARDTPHADSSLYLPVVGPWVHLADSSATATNTTTDTLLVAGSGIIQGAGIGLAIASLFVSESVPTATIRAGDTKVHFTPTSFGVGSAGVGAGGTF